MDEHQKRLRDITLSKVGHPQALAGLHALEFHEAGAYQVSTFHLDDEGLQLLVERLYHYYLLPGTPVEWP